jgi:alpha-D-ribose 1-methylphosphonate 5-triphosphate diphosphatase
MIRKIGALREGLKVRTRLHARYEITDIAALPLLDDLIREPGIDLLSVMDHTPGQGQFKEIVSFKNYYGRVYQKSEEELDRIIHRKTKAKEDHGEESLRAVIELCRLNGIPLASHDDDTAEKVSWLNASGISISEFPVTFDAARAAHELGLSVCFGAPNVLRGSSQTKNLSARDALAEGIGSILCSDYSPMSMLHAVFSLHEAGLRSIPESVRMVSMNPALALGIAGTVGSIAVGKSADFVLVDVSGQVPVIRRTFVAGREVFATC